MVRAREVDTDFDNDSDVRVLLLVHDTKPPFLDGRFLFTKQKGEGRGGGHQQGGASTRDACRRHRGQPGQLPHCSQARSYQPPGMQALCCR